MNSLDPTPAQAVAMQAAKANKKGKNGGADRVVSSAAEEKRGRQYSPYQRRDKDGEDNGEAPPQGGNPQRTTNKQSTPQGGKGKQVTPHSRSGPGNTHESAPPPPTIPPPPLPAGPSPTPQGTVAHIPSTPPLGPPAPLGQATHVAQPSLAQLPVPLVQSATHQTQVQTAGPQDVKMGHAAGENTEEDGIMQVDQPENPHLQTTSVVPLTTLPPRPGKGYAGGPFPHTVIASDDLFKSIRVEILDNLLKSPLDFLFLLPYGAGRRLHAEFPNLGDTILEYIKEFRAPNCDNLTVVKAAADSFIKGKKLRMYKKDFEPPWVFILSGFSPELRDFLLGVGVFDFAAGESNHALTVLKVQKNVRSWHVAYLTGDGVTNDRRMMEEGLTAIKAKIKNNEKVRTSVQECYAERTGTNLLTTDDKVQDALSTLSITYTSNGKANFWHLTAKPITDDPAKHKRWEEALRDTKNFVLRKIFAVDISWGFE